MRTVVICLVVAMLACLSSRPRPDEIAVLGVTVSLLQSGWEENGILDSPTAQTGGSRLLDGWFLAASSGNVLRVPGDFPSIQAAVDAAQEHDTILVGDGNYAENVVVSKSLLICSEHGRNVTFVIAKDPNRHAFNLTSDFCTIQGFTITGATGSGRSGIYASGRTNLTLIANSASWNFNGVWVDGPANVTILDNIAEGNRGHGFHVSTRHGNCALSSSTLSGNTARGNGEAGMYIEQAQGIGNNSVTIADNWLEGNTVGLQYASKKGAFPGVFHLSDWDVAYGWFFLKDEWLLHDDWFHNPCLGQERISGNKIVSNSDSGLVVELNHGAGYVTWIVANNVSHNLEGIVVSDLSGAGCTLIDDNCVCHNEGPGVSGVWKNGGLLIASRFWNNTIEYNDGPGLALLSLKNSHAVPIVGNRVMHNGGSGILMGDIEDGGPNHIWDNVICYNEGVGIEMVNLRNGGNSSISRNVIRSNGGRAAVLDPELKEEVEDYLKGMGLPMVGPDPIGGIAIVADRSRGYRMVDNVIESNVGHGIYVHCSKSGTGLIEGNEIKDNEGDGIGIYYSRALNNRSIKNNIVSGNAGRGVMLGPGVQQGYDVIANHILANSIGVHLDGSRNVTISTNIISSGSYGIMLDSSADDRIAGNFIHGAAQHGIKVLSGSSNSVSGNSLSGNNGASEAYDPSRAQAFDSGTDNLWNNHWSDWTSPDADGDGVVDLPYVLDGSSGARDLHPLVRSPFVRSSPPLPPRDLCAVGGPGRVNLSWAAPLDCFVGDVLLYRIYRGNETHRFYLAAVPSGSTSYTDHDVEGEQVYYYQLTASSSIAESRPSNLVFATPSHPFTLPIVKILSPRDGSYLDTGHLAFAWLGDGNGSRLLRYESRIDKGAWVDMDLAVSWSMPMLADGEHEVEVRAFNAGGGNGSASVRFVIDTVPPAIAIRVPANNTFANSSIVQSSWEGEDFGSGILAYRGSLDAGGWFDLGHKANFVMTGLAEGSHTFDLAAVDRAGNQGSSRVMFVVDLTRPRVLSHEPTGSDVAPDANVTVSFSERMDASFTGLILGQLMGSVTWMDQTIIFDPAENLTLSANYTVSVAGRDLAGNLLEGFAWSFTVRQVGEDGLVAIALLAVGGGFDLLRRKRRVRPRISRAVVPHAQLGGQCRELLFVLACAQGRPWPGDRVLHSVQRRCGLENHDRHREPAVDESNRRIR